MRFSFIIYTSPSLKAGILILEIYYTYVKSSKVDIYKNINADRPIEKELEITRPILF